LNKIAGIVIITFFFPCIKFAPISCCVRACVHHAVAFPFLWKKKEKRVDQGWANGLVGWKVGMVKSAGKKQFAQQGGWEKGAREEMLGDSRKV
jgi:hypothetical protein